MENDHSSPSMRTRVKRRRTKARDVMTVVQPEPCYLFRLPVEVVAEVLSYTTTPKEILALARTSKRLCKILTNERASFIWRAARARCVPSSIPDPTWQFTESSYAAFIFDGGTCYICEKPTKLMLHSFALRVRLCLSKTCFETFRSDKLREISIAAVNAPNASAWTPVAEVSRVYARPHDRVWNLHNMTWPSIAPHYLISELDRRQTEYIACLNDQSEGAQERKEQFKAHVRDVLIPHKQQTMDLAVKLQQWKENYLKHASSVRRLNEQFATSMAKQLGCELGDLLVTPSFGLFYRNRTNEMVIINQHNFDVDLRHVMILEIERLRASRERKKAEAHIRRKQEIVAEYYHRAQLASPGSLMPSLRTFRQMSTVVSLEKYQGTPEQLEAELKKTDSVTSMLVQDMIEEWRKDVRRELAVKLNVKPGKNKNVLLHPAERLNARFYCTRCGHVSKSFKEDGCLTLAGVCLHECHKPKGKQTYKWHTRYFAPAEKPIRVINQALAVCGIDPASKNSFDSIRTISSRFLCDSCPAAIVMDFKQLIGHSTRHEDMQISLLSEAEADAILIQRLEMGLHKRLTDRSDKVLHEQRRCIYGCRHCTQECPIIAPPSSAAILVKGTDGTSEPVTAQGQSMDIQMADGIVDKTRGLDVESHKQAARSNKKSKRHKAETAPKQVLRDFNGLRSHVKAKHGIEDLRDEDFFRLVLE